MNKDVLFRGESRVVLTPENIKDLMTSSVVGLDFFYNFIGEPYFGVTDVLFGRKDLCVAIQPLELKEDPSIKGCLFWAFETNSICFWYGNFPARKIEKTREVSVKFEDGTVHGKTVTIKGMKCLKLKM